MEKKAILFDFDGVIVDTLELNLQLNKEHGNPVTIEEYRKMFEGNIFSALSIRHEREITQEDNDNWTADFAPRMLEIDPVENMVDMLKDLGSRYITTVVSSTVSNPISEYLAKHGLTKYFDKVFGSDVHMSKVEKIKMVFDEFDVSAGDCIFVTDTLGDMREATETGVSSIGVTWGFHPRETLEKGSPAYVVDSPEALVLAVDSFFQN